MRTAPEEKKLLKPATPVRTKDVVINWKRALTEVLCQKEDQISAERNWARLCVRLRDLCPETNWTFINNTNSYAAREDIEALHVWLEKLVADPSWPFPEQIIVTSECHDKEYSWKLLFPRTVVKLPYATPPHSLTITPYYDKQSSGWTIRAIDSFTLNQAGEA